MSAGSGRRVAITLADQLVSSGSNFAVGVLVARLVQDDRAQFGAYMLAFTCWLCVVGLHRAIITEPIILRASGPGRDRDHLAEGVAAEFVFGSVASATLIGAGLVMTAVGEGPVGRPLATLGCWLIPLLLQDYWRAMAFRQQRPWVALANDVSFAIVQLAVMAVLWFGEVRSVPWAVTAWGLGATTGAVIGFLEAGVHPSLSGGWTLIREQWPSNRWLTVDFLTQFSTDQFYVLAVAALLGSAAYGGYRACLSLVGPATVIMLAGGNLGLPEISTHWNNGDHEAARRTARFLTLAVTGCITAYCGIVAIFSRQLLQIFGDDYTQFANLARLAALAYVIYALVFGQLLMIKVAGQMRSMVGVRITVTVASLGIVAILTELLGVTGAGWTALAVACLFTAGVQTLYLRRVHGGTAGRAQVALG